MPSYFGVVLMGLSISIQGMSSRPSSRVNISKTNLAHAVVFPILISLALMIFCSPVRSQEAAVGAKVSAVELLRRAVNGELQAQAKDHSHWMYEVRSEESGERKIKWVIETSAGDVDRLESVNGRRISTAQAEQETQRIEGLVHTPEAQQEQRHSQEEDARKTEQMFRLMPDAVLARYGAREGGLVEIIFKPNPNFHPSSREGVVFHAMAGRIWINEKENRLAEIEGHLIREVKFGGGFLGYLEQGGEFHVRQIETAPGHWEVSLLRVNMQGKALFFKTISVQQNELRSEFQRVGDNITLAEAAEDLQRRCTVQTAALPRADLSTQISQQMKR